MNAPFKFKKVKDVTLQLFKMKPNGPAMYFRFDSEMFEGKKIKDDDHKDPAILINVTNLETGEAGQIIAPTLLRSALIEAYIEKNESYVGRCFELSMTRIPSEKYNRINLIEISIENDKPVADSAEVDHVKKGHKK